MEGVSARGRTGRLAGYSSAAVTRPRAEVQCTREQDGGASSDGAHLRQPHGVAAAVRQAREQLVPAAEAATAAGPNESPEVAVRRLLGTLTFASRLETSPYANLLSPALWRDAAKRFEHDCLGLLGLPRDSPLSVAVDAGALVLPSLHKLANVESKLASAASKQHRAWQSVDQARTRHSLAAPGPRPHDLIRRATFAAAGRARALAAVALSLRLHVPRLQGGSVTGQSSDDVALRPRPLAQHHRQGAQGAF